MILDDLSIEKLIGNLISEKKVMIGVSNRHIHLSRENLDTLFGKDYRLNILKELKQPGQFAAKETVELHGPKGILSKVRVLGPTRNVTQIEVSKTDSFTIGLKCPVRESGDIENTPGIKIVGPYGFVDLDCGVIVASRHIHMDPEFAKNHNYFDGDQVSVLFNEGNRRTLMHDVKIRVKDGYSLEMHIDTDEANAISLYNGAMVEIIRG